MVQQAVSDWASRFEIHQTTRTELPGYCTVEYAGESEDRKSASRNDNVLKLTVQRVAEMYRDIPDRSIGILVRTNESVGRLIFMLQEAGIAASEEGGNPLTDSAAVQMILSAIWLADHPGDSVARFHLSHGPLAAHLGLQPEVQENQSSNSLAAAAAASTIRRQLAESGYGPACEHFARLLSRDCTRRELNRIQQLVQEAFNYDGSQQEANQRLRPSRFVNHIRNEYRASDQSSARVRVMTIHQSKGLEFDIVLLPMLFTTRGWFGQQDPVIVGRERPTEPINLVCRLANAKHRKLLPEEFQEAFEETRRREVHDNLCVLYVALTRAVHATHVVLSYSCKPENISGAGVLLSTLVADWTEAIRDEGLVYEHGQKDWYRHGSSPRPLTEDKPRRLFYLPADARIAAPSFASSPMWPRGVERISPSGLEGAGTVSPSRIFSSDAAAGQLQRGTLIHACFERIQWLDEPHPDPRQLSEQLQVLTPDREQSEQAVQDFQRMIESLEIRKLLTRHDFLANFRPELIAKPITVNQRWKVQAVNERRFAIRLNGHRMMQGTIDRLVLIYDGDDLIAADLVDYKTDQLTESDSKQRRIVYYQPQLLAYRQAVASLFRLPIEMVAARLVFLEVGDIVRVDSSNRIPASEKREGTPREAGKNRSGKAALGHTNQLKLWSED